jgi:hypothetical protein
MIESLFDVMTPAQREAWREKSRKGGRAVRGAVKARAARIGWKKKPNRFFRPKAGGFTCSNCGHWHDFPADIDDYPRVKHTCRCGQRHTIIKRRAFPRKNR